MNVMRREPHPLSGTYYEHLGDGKVKVQKEGSNAYGIFDYKGEWLEGEVTQADPLDAALHRRARPATRS